MPCASSGPPFSFRNALNAKTRHARTESTHPTHTTLPLAAITPPRRCTVVVSRPRLLPAGELLSLTLLLRPRFRRELGAEIRGLVYLPDLDLGFRVREGVGRAL